MKGIVLADGSGTRSYSITKGISKLMMMGRLENMLFGNEKKVSADAQLSWRSRRGALAGLTNYTEFVKA